MNRANTYECLKNAKAGNVEAFIELFETYRGVAFQVARRIVGIDSAEDVVMESYIRAWKALPKFNNKSSLKTWIYRITYNCALEYAKRESRQSLRTNYEDDESNSKGESVDYHDPSDAIQKTETVVLLRQAIDELTVEHRVTMLLRYIDECSYRDIADVTGVSVGTVMSRIHNAKKRLRRLYSNKFDKIESTAQDQSRAII